MASYGLVQTSGRDFHFRPVVFGSVARSVTMDVARSLATASRSGGNDSDYLSTDMDVSGEKPWLPHGMWGSVMWVSWSAGYSIRPAMAL